MKKKAAVITRKNGKPRNRRLHTLHAHLLGQTRCAGSIRYLDTLTRLALLLRLQMGPCARENHGRSWRRGRQTPPPRMHARLHVPCESSDTSARPSGHHGCEEHIHPEIAACVSLVHLTNCRQTRARAPQEPAKAPDNAWVKRRF